MQIRSHGVTDRVYDPIRLEGDFPVMGGDTMTVSNSAHFLHRHNVLEIGYCYEGHGVFIIGDDVHPFAAGDVSVINGGVFHIAKSSDDSDSTWAFVHVDPYRFTASLAPGSLLSRVAELYKTDHSPLLRSGEHPRISSIVEEMLSEMQQQSEFFQIAVGGLITLLASKLYRVNPSVCETSQHQDNYAMERIAPALQYIATQYTEPMPISTLASLCCVSEAQLRRLFHLAVGQSPHGYMTKFRLGMAVSLLDSTTLPVLDIAGRVGYSSVSSFNRHFKAEFGVSPRQWRYGKIVGSGLVHGGARTPAQE